MICTERWNAPGFVQLRTWYDSIIFKNQSPTAADDELTKSLAIAEQNEAAARELSDLYRAMDTPQLGTNEIVPYSTQASSPSPGHRGTATVPASSPAARSTPSTTPASTGPSISRAGGPGNVFVPGTATSSSIHTAPISTRSSHSNASSSRIASRRVPAPIAAPSEELIHTGTEGGGGIAEVGNQIATMAIGDLGEESEVDIYEIDEAVPQHAPAKHGKGKAQGATTRRSTRTKAK